jgi:hypothetical protein
MIIVSYEDFISSNGEIEIENAKGKLHSLFAIDANIKLEELDKVYNVDNIEDFIQDILSLLNNEQNNTDEGAFFIILKFIGYLYCMLWIFAGTISTFTLDERDFKKKYAKENYIHFEDIGFISQEHHMFPLPYITYQREFNDGTEEVLGHGVLWFYIITDD